MMRQITQAMILSAGLGTRMGELVKDIPKPMLPVKGITLIERNLKYLQQNAIKKVVINTYYKADLFEAFVKSLPIFNELEICFSREEELLGPGGGIKQALPFFDNKAFFTLNSDGLFEDLPEETPALDILEQNWCLESMLNLLLTIEKANSFGYYGKGDFDIDETGQLNQDNIIRNLIYPGASIMDYRLFDNYPEKILQLSPTVYKDLMQQKKLPGVIYHGKWYHIGDTKAYNEFAI